VPASRCGKRRRSSGPNRSPRPTARGPHRRAAMHRVRGDSPDRSGAPHPAVTGRLRRPALRRAPVSTALPPRLRSRRARLVALPGAEVEGAARPRGRTRGADRGAPADQRTALGWPMRQRCSRRLGDRHLSVRRPKTTVSGGKTGGWGPDWRGPRMTIYADVVTKARPTAETRAPARQGARALTMTERPANICCHEGAPIPTAAARSATTP
jgi:hypothetical protein